MRSLSFLERKMLELINRGTANLTAEERGAITRVIGEAFELTVPAEQVANYYLHSMPMVLLAHERGSLIGFQFYRNLDINGTYICLFSLAGKRPNAGHGLQRAFGARLMRQVFRKLSNPFRPLAIAGIANNPKTYRNMRLIGGSIFPDVLRPGREFQYKPLYDEMARRLDLKGFEPETGLVRNRLVSLGLRMRSTAYEDRSTPIHEKFMRYVDNDVNNGILTMAVSTPLAAVTCFALDCSENI